MIRKFKDIEPKIDETSYVSESAVVIGKVKIGKNSSIWDCAVLRGDVDTITIGDETNIQDGSTLHVDYNIPLTIGNRVTIGHGVNLHGCTIGDNSLIGIGAIVLNGAVVGKNCIVGAGALVTPKKNIPDNSLVLGSPAKVVRDIKQEEIDANIKNSKMYCILANDHK